VEPGGAKASEMEFEGVCTGAVMLKSSRTSAHGYNRGWMRQSYTLRAWHRVCGNGSALWMNSGTQYCVQNTRQHDICSVQAGCSRRGCDHAIASLMHQRLTMLLPSS
jgi:hypothetical protein